MQPEQGGGPDLGKVAQEAAPAEAAAGSSCAAGWLQQQDALQEQPGQAPLGSIQGAELAIQPGKPGLHPLEPSALPKCHTVQPRLKAILAMNLKAGN